MNERLLTFVLGVLLIVAMVLFLVAAFMLVGNAESQSLIVPIWECDSLVTDAETLVCVDGGSPRWTLHYSNCDENRIVLDGDDNYATCYTALEPTPVCNKGGNCPPGKNK